MQNQDWTRENVEHSLNTILSDAKFVAAPQMSAFLRFVVEQTLDGKADRIKAYTVAIDALGKPSTFDPQNDPSVRVLAKRLRDTLSAYYERTSGHKVIVQLKSGSYVPAFVVPDQQSTADAANDMAPVMAPRVEPQNATTPVYRSGSATPSEPAPERSSNSGYNGDSYKNLEPLKKNFEQNPFANHPLKKIQQG